MKKYLFGLVLLISISLCGCTIGSDEQQMGEGTGQEESQSSTVAENMQSNASDDISDSDLSTVGESWQDKQQNNSTTVLSYEKGGEQEEKTASLYVGEGYSLYVIDGDWSMYLPDAWEAENDRRIRFLVSSYEGLNTSQAERILAGYGFKAGDGYLWKQESDILYMVKCYETESDVWRLEAIYPTEAEDWEADIWAMFDTFEVEEGYSVGEHTPKAVMPEGEYPQLYEVTYTDSVSRAWAVHEPEYAGSYIYDELTISNITDTSFDFTVTRRNFETDETEVIIPKSTAYINEDMISATYIGDDYTLTFDFSDSANPLPVILTIKLWGVESLEGIQFINDSIPGYESG